jgi:catechol 2,3-dioxygenase-like lactoylglutathione lyase family enzyme
MAKMKSVAGVICLVKELEPSITFYEKLGFEFRKQVPGVAATAYLNWFWIEFLLEDKVVTEAYKEDITVSPKGAGQYIHIDVEDVDVFHKFVLEKGLEPLSEPQDFPWGHREFVLRDPSGYKLVFFNKLK